MVCERNAYVMRQYVLTRVVRCRAVDVSLAGRMDTRMRDLMWFWVIRGWGIIYYLEGVLSVL